MKLVLIEWIDSHSGRGWQPLQDLETTSELLHCRTVGWLLSNTKDVKHIVSTVAGEKNKTIIEQGCCCICIPNKSITKMKVLQK